MVIPRPAPRGEHHHRRSVKQQGAHGGETPNVTIQDSPMAVGSVYTHPAVGGWSNRPSENDVNVAKKLKQNVWVVSRSGLRNVDKDGQITNVHSDPEWMKKTSPK
jgi:hypothetical protein